MIVFAVLTFAQAVVEVPHFLTLGNVVVTIAGAAIAIGLRILDKKLDMLMDVRDKTLKVWAAIYGEAESSDPDGLLHETKAARQQIACLAHDFTLHVEKETLWQEQLARNTTRAADRAQEALTGIDSRLEKVEEKLAPRGKR